MPELPPQDRNSDETQLSEKPLDSGVVADQSKRPPRPFIVPFRMRVEEASKVVGLVEKFPGSKIVFGSTPDAEIVSTQMIMPCDTDMRIVFKTMLAALNPPPSTNAAVREGEVFVNREKQLPSPKPRTKPVSPLQRVTAMMRSSFPNPSAHTRTG